MSDRLQSPSASTRLIGYGLLLAPAASLGIAAAAVNTAGFAVGAIVAGIVALLLARKHPVWRPPNGVPLIAIYLVAACWLWADAKGGSEPVAKLARGSLAVIGVGLFAVTELFRTGAEPRRRAANICRRILNRPHWPITISDCRDVAEVQELRDALREDMSPVVRLMADARPEVRTAGFAALENRPHWRSNEAKLILNAARNTVESAVRAQAAYSLGGIRQGELVSEVAGFLRDPAAEVRSAAAAGLLLDGGKRWPMIRELVKAALSDPRLVSDGGLPGVAGYLPVLAICDLTAWTSEGGILAERSVRTLLEHHHVHLKAAHRVTYSTDLSRQLFDQSLSTDLRVGLSRLLKKHDFLDRSVLDRMTSAEQPGPIRLMAAEILISDDGDNADGLDVLRGLGRQQNREISLSIARVLQKYLGMDMGLPNGPLAPQSKQAGEIVKRVMMWASGKDWEASIARSERPTPPSMFPGLDAPIPTARLRKQQQEDELDFSGGPVNGPQSIIR